MAALEEAFGDVIQRQITDDASFERWKGSSARKEIVAFVTRLNNSCVNKSNLRLDEAPPQVRKLMDALRAIAKGCDQYLPKPGEARRYGSPMFRDWHAWLVQTTPELVASLNLVDDARYGAVLIDEASQFPTTPPRRGPARAASLTFCLLYTSPSPRDVEESRMPSSA